MIFKYLKPIFKYKKSIIDIYITIALEVKNLIYYQNKSSFINLDFKLIR